MALANANVSVTYKTKLVPVQEKVITLKGVKLSLLPHEATLLMDILSRFGQDGTPNSRVKDLRKIMVALHSAGVKGSRKRDIRAPKGMWIGTRRNG